MSCATSLAARRQIGYVPETAPLYGHMRVRRVPRASWRGCAASRPRRSATAVDRVVAAAGARRGRRQAGARPVARLSASARRSPRRWCTIRQIIILDEPTNGLDPRQIIEMRGLIRALAGRHTVLMSSHVLGEVEKTADRVGLLLDGQAARRARDGRHARSRSLVPVGGMRALAHPAAQGAACDLHARRSPIPWRPCSCWCWAIRSA